MMKENYAKHYLYPAALFASKVPHQVTTILGTCVAVCLWDPVLKQGGINHYMLPFWNGDGLASPKYGNIAIEKLIEKLIINGSQKKNLVAKVFGGKEESSENAGLFHIGERNYKIAINMLEEERIPIVASNAGGQLGRKLYFYTDTGEVFMNFIKPSERQSPK
jgi:chemotaxis protein CheD